ncbi:Class E vacuolar protein-sorting machinery protein HSE1 [Golovinomyces cichoracearum]|uniref:Class E vacuolar protein-sorting machinery protein HSE1 n=1 Tax=Golovinomyces cichoracearum TaxID=62708 RepID=A0A420IS38_9PEZI|nr:Class E vacuolar protein-sorting machinery protein HSE1 [Golovinomyces cichoracearum]
MFRAAQNPYDEIVAKATDENLTSENWEYIIDVCDKVTADENGAKDAMLSIIKRLAHRNANVQLYTLELANSLSQNCGFKLHRELASRAFTDALLRLAADRNTHHQVKAKILERMQEWSEMFQDPDLGIMRDQYHELKNQNPHLQPPSAPLKNRLTDLDRQKEEEELQMALRLSIQQDKPANTHSTQQPASSTRSAEISDEPQKSLPLPSGTTAATVSRVRALYDFKASDPDELTFCKGDIIAVLESVYKDWWKGLLRGQTGIFPLNYVEKLTDPTPEEIQREAQTEAEVFAEIKNVEKLLTLLSTASPDLKIQDNDEIGKLYYSTLAIRPKLIELIGKYSQKKDEFTQLNERFIKSCRDYENLLDSSVTHNQSSYHSYSQAQGRDNPPHVASPVPQDPIKTYSPAPVQNQNFPQHSYSNSAHVPPRNGPAPFYIVSQRQQAPNESHGPPNVHSQKQSSPFTPASSTIGPVSPPQASTFTTNQNFPPHSQPGHHNTAHSPLTHELPAQSFHVPHPSTLPPPPPSLTAGYPVVNQSFESLETQNLNQSHGPYTAYRPPSQNEYMPSAPPGNPADFYRSSTTS